jgi:uncharacterized membrane protein YfcA
MPELFAGLDPRTFALLAVLALVALGYLLVLARGVRQVSRATGERAAPTAALTGTGFVANFFDTLGIGSFATTTAIVRQFRLLRDERLPGTLNAGHALPTIVQAFIFTQAVEVDPKTLLLMIVAAVLGAWLGAGVVAGLPRRAIQLGMGVALLAAATLIVLTLADVLPGGGTALQLTGGRLVAGLVGNFLLGALMTLGIGLYGPCMVLVSLLGMNPTAAFPIMMGSCAFLMPVASARFIRERAFDPRAAVSFVLGGVPAVLIAAFIVKSLPLTAVRWLVVAVVVYTAVGLLLAARRRSAAEGDVAGTPAPQTTPAVTP